MRNLPVTEARDQKTKVPEDVELNDDDADFPGVEGASFNVSLKSDGGG